MMALKVFIYVIVLLFHTGYSLAGEQTRFYISDKLTQSSVILDEFGNIVGKERLGSFGDVKFSSTEIDDWKHSYHGKPTNFNHGLVNFGARFYDPQIGRFLTIDPRGFNESSIQSFNRYAFANNNPYRYTDPDGRVVESAWDFANVAIGANSLMNNIIAGNWRAAGVDGMGLAVDVFAAAVPFVPGGASAVINAERNLDGVKSFAGGTEEASSTSRYSAEANDLSLFSRASEFGVQTHSSLIKAKKGMGLDGHHLIEKRFADILGVKPNDMYSVALTKAEHQVFTNQWRKAFPYGKSMEGITKESLGNAASNIYKDYPTLLDYALKDLAK